MPGGIKSSFPDCKRASAKSFAKFTKKHLQRSPLLVKMEVANV